MGEVVVRGSGGVEVLGEEYICIIYTSDLGLLITLSYGEESRAVSKGTLGEH